MQSDPFPKNAHGSVTVTLIYTQSGKIFSKIHPISQKVS